MEFTGVEFADGAKLATSVEKDAASSVEKATIGPHILGCHGM
jgi:hypothetical protein